MGEVLNDGVEGGARALARVAEPFHAITYYSRELVDMTDEGYRGWWHAYFGYRPAPMGPVSASMVTSVFYNFAPRMVAKAVPGVWAINAPSDALAMRLGRVERALARIFPQGAETPGVRAAADLIRSAIADCPVAARPLYAAYAELEWPDDDLVALWHGCTLLREYRFDGHNTALAAAEVDGVACHLLMAGRGHGNRPTILAIRGWNEEEWDAALESLRSRGWIGADGELTESGVEAHSAIERHTDALAGEPVRRLGEDGLETVLDAMTPLVAHLRDTDEVTGRWPPPHLIKSEGGS